MKTSFLPARRRSGLALVVVLGLIVVLALILVAFVSQTRVDVAASSSFSQSVSAENLAQDAVNTITGQLQREIELGSTTTTTNSLTVYQPSTLLDSFPKLDASIPTGATAGTNAAAVPNLLRTSSEGNLYIGTGATASAASSVSTDQKAVDGQRVSREQWNTPRLLSTAQNQNTLLPIPKWIYVDRTGPKKLTAWTTTLADPYTTAGQVNTSFVIGRYAYRIYDLGGLMDVNVAGYPGQAIDPASKPRIGRKGGLPWANVADAGFGGWPGVNAGSALHFPTWRGPKTNHDDYVDGKGIYLGQGGNDTGFLQTISGAAGANRFLNRADLLGFLKSSGQFSNNGFDFAPQVTVFTRETNAPSWQTDRTPAASPATVNAFAPTVAVNSAFTRANGTRAVVGEPLLKYRFPLSKIALLTDPVGNAVEIEKYFGLRKSTNDGSGPWSYVHGTTADSAYGDGPRERLRTLQEVATLSREPNFFELLQAGIMADTLGMAVATPANFTLQSAFYDKNIARHILQIGANIIDQYDEDDNPTWIERTNFEDLAGASTEPDPDISGIENLPYIHLISWLNFRDRSGRAEDHASTEAGEEDVNPWILAYHTFQLWNPHRNAAQAQPGQFRLVAKGAPQVRSEGETSSGGALNIDTAPATPPWTPAQAYLEFLSDPARATANFAEPRLVRSTDTAPVSGGGLGLVIGPQASSYNVNSAGIVGFKIGEVLGDYSNLRKSGDAQSHQSLYGTATAILRWWPGNGGLIAQQTTSFQLQKWNDVTGEWVPVQTIANFNRSTATYRMSNLIPPASGVGGDTQAVHNGPFMRRHWALPDPRTIRFGPVFGNGDSGLSWNAAAGGFLTDPASLYALEWLTSNAGGAGGSNFNDAQTVQLYQNLESSAGNTYYRNRGSSGTVSMGDSPTHNPLTDPAGRPVVLNRPFLDVSEMAYAGRDLPWRTLNFSQEFPSNPNGSGRMANTSDSALLDYFTIQPEPAVRAGVVNLNSASKEVIKALLLWADPLGSTYGPDTKITDSEAEDAATAIYEYLGNNLRAEPSADRIIQTSADIPRMVQDMVIKNLAFQTWPKVKREAVVAALTRAHNARTWNLMIDVVAQSGRFPKAGTGALDRFQVTGAKRLWVHVAIDRLTGKVVDRIVETASE